MLKLDLGCGPNKRPRFIGVDAVGHPDVLCDIATEPLPFEDVSADHIYSSHCVEMIPFNRLPHVFQEMTRVCVDGGLIEVWHPHFSHGDAYVFGQACHLSDALYDHLGCTYRDFWGNAFGGARWILQEIRYGIDPHVLEDIEAAGMNMDFAVSYLRDVIREMGVFIRVDRSGSAAPSAYRRIICQPGEQGRHEVIVHLSDGPRRERLPAEPPSRV